MAGEKANPMSFLSKLGFGMGGIAAFFARRPIVASYDRSVQYATDVYIKVWGAILLILGIIVFNAIFMWMEWHGAQTTLLIASFIIGLYYALAPAIAVPLVGLAAAIRAGEPGDQVNIWLLRDGLKDFVNNAGVVFFWMGVYILATIIAPFGLYLELFLFGHTIIVLMLALVMSGKIEMSDKVYQIAWKSCIALLVGGLLTVMMFREQLGPWWAEHTASRATRVESAQRTEAIRAIDRAHAKWLEKHVRTTEDGRQVITVIGADGQKKEADAAPYKARRQQERDATIASLSTGGKGASAVALGASGLIAGHLLWILLFGGAGLGWYVFKKKDGETATKATPAKVEASGGIGKYVLLAALAGGGYYAWNNPAVMDWLPFSGSDVKTKSVVRPSMTELNRADFTARFDYTNHHIDLPWRMWDKKDAKITHDCSITFTGGVKCMVAFGEGNRALDLYLAEGKCAEGNFRTAYVCDGTWRGGELEGYFRGEWNPQGTVFRVRLCEKDWKKTGCVGIATIGFTNVPKDNR